MIFILSLVKIHDSNPQQLSIKSKNSAYNGWKICGTDIHDENARTLEPAEQVDQPTILVLGNEGEGLSKNVIKKCDEHVYIGSIEKSDNRNDFVDSLNVSVATGILLNSFTR